MVDHDGRPLSTSRRRSLFYADISGVDNSAVDEHVLASHALSAGAGKPNRKSILLIHIPAMTHLGIPAVGALVATLGLKPKVNIVLCLPRIHAITSCGVSTHILMMHQLTSPLSNVCKTRLTSRVPQTFSQCAPSFGTRRKLSTPLLAPPAISRVNVMIVQDMPMTRLQPSCLQIQRTVVSVARGQNDAYPKSGLRT